MEERSQKVEKKDWEILTGAHLGEGQAGGGRGLAGPFIRRIGVPAAAFEPMGEAATSPAHSNRRVGGGGN